MKEEGSMEKGRMVTWMLRGLSVTAVLAAVGACSSGSTPRESHAYVFTNGGFEMGTAGVAPQSWTVTTNLNTNGVVVQTPETFAGLQLAAGGKALTTTIADVDQPDPNLGATASLRVCRYGLQCARVNFDSSSTFGNGQNVNTLSQTMTIAGGDVDPTDGLIHVRFVDAPVLQNPSHPAAEQPYYFVQLTDVTQGGAILYRDFNLSAQAGVPWKTINGGTAAEIDYVDWSLVDITSPTIQIGDMVTLEVIASGCEPSGHYGYIYVDGVGSTVPGLFISGTGPAQANAGTNITYNLTYKNGSAAAETGLVIDFTTPPNTTFQSILPPTGATCTTPAVGTAGTIVCTFTGTGTIAAGASGSFTVTVNITAGTTGTITAGTYQISSTQETPLLGPHIYTIVGCTLDAQCPAGDWCDETAPSNCTPTLANGTLIPTDAPHTNPTMSGTCTLGAGALVCTSAVCDTVDNKCGYANGDGTCTVTNAAVVCRSGACDPDTKCGYANGDGPCGAANAAVVCRSGACSANLTCEPVGGCNVDADCVAGTWCDESVHTCTPSLANGVAVPTDPPHVSPTLNGTCTVAAGTLVCASAVCDTNDNDCGYANGDGICSVANEALVCRSGVCDPDTKCGYAVGDGPCSVANAATVCRSGVCSTNLTCEPAGGCDVDADCSGGNWCDESTHVCTPPLSNGMSVPNDPPHTNPVLNGACTTVAAALVCRSGVCDASNNECGYANGDGPCSVATGSVLCQSGVCSASSSVCIPTGGCAVDADCLSTQYCNTPSLTCVSKVPNGQIVPTVVGHAPPLSGVCTVAAAAAACASAVCDTNDNDCGFANGDGPCTAGSSASVCRSGVCSVGGTCEAAGGCNVDADCATGQWCNESAHVCTAQLANGVAVPTDASHASPTLNGICTAAAGILVCQSGVCDINDNKCGYASGDGPCTAADGAVDCRSTLCLVVGSNPGLCIACTSDTQCSGATPSCNTTTHACVQCTSSSNCPSEDPVCDTPSSTCVLCNGDFGSTATEACGSMGEPFCTLSGSGAGQCGKCTTNAECVGHLGNICDTTSGLCTAQCGSDADCLSSQWCNAAPGARGMCTAKEVNGTPLPSMPATVATCSTVVGQRVCLSTVCDTKTNECGFATGDGPCTGNAECVDGMCDDKTETCGAMDAGSDAGAAQCHADSDCTTAHFCSSSSVCTPTLPTGGACDRAAECQSNDCIAGVCSVVVSSGSGLLCSVREPGGTGSTGAGIFGLVFALAGAGLRRRRAQASV